ncbi:MAG: cell division protein ZipA [Gammaproteobacteria bacterium]|nr:cell division protein ZipA [Gammaproteobacteria bacterium]
MPELRIILLVLGAVLVLGIYLADRYRRRRARRSEYWSDAALDDENLATGGEDDLAEEHLADHEWVGQAFSARRDAVIDEVQLEGLKGLANSEKDTPAPEEPPLYGSRVPAEVVKDELSGGDKPQANKPTSSQEQVIVLTLMAAEGTVLRGTRLLKALQDNGMRHGEMEIFHFTPEGMGRPLFSAANILEPGRFDLSEMAQLETPGIALFMQLPGPISNSEALKLLLQKARQIAAALGATLCDGQRRPLDDKGLAELEQRVLG